MDDFPFFDPEQKDYELHGGPMDGEIMKTPINARMITLPDGSYIREGERFLWRPAE